jgi:hypothetical protein
VTNERLMADIEIWQARAASPLFPAADISLLLAEVKTWPNAAVLEQLILDATDNQRIASVAHLARESALAIGPESARDEIDRLNDEHAYVAQMLHNIRVRKAIEADREGQCERNRLATEITAFVEQRRMPERRLSVGSGPSCWPMRFTPGMRYLWHRPSLRLRASNATSDFTATATPCVASTSVPRYR